VREKAAKTTHSAAAIPNPLATEDIIAVSQFAALCRQLRGIEAIEIFLT
jgi:hypothetical protein